MKKILLATFFATLCLMLPTLHSCDSKADEAFFDDYVMMFDGELPKYTEYGYNTAGANVAIKIAGRSNQIWTLYSSGASAVIVKTETGICRLTMSGQMLYQQMTLMFDLAEMPDSLLGLQDLVGRQFSLNPASNLDYTSASLKVTSSRAIYKAEQLYGVSFSGRFEASVLMSGGAGGEDEENSGAAQSVKVSDGRFDILFKSHDGTTISN